MKAEHFLETKYGFIDSSVLLVETDMQIFGSVTVGSTILPFFLDFFFIVEARQVLYIQE